MITYTLKKGGSIECAGYSSEFTLDQLKEQMANKKKTIKELAANADVRQLTVENILEHNKFIAKMKPEQIHACFMYHEAKCAQMSYAQKVTEFKTSLRKDRGELKEILRQIPELNTEENGK